MNSLESANPKSAPSIPEYELIRLIGRGAYGEVWLARAITGVYRAIKIITRSKFSDDGPFEREFRGLKEFAAFSVKEPAQLAILHVGRNEAAGFFYYVMELADDARDAGDFDPATYRPVTLARRRAERGRLGAEEGTTIGIALAQALAALHGRGLVHRDVKPANIVFVGGKPKLADIGLVATAAEALTYVGTDGYIPPEGAGTPAADVYSLGRVLYELTTGLDRNDFPRLPAGWEKYPDHRQFSQLNRVILRAADPARNRRYPSADQLLADLSAIAAGKKVAIGPRFGRGSAAFALTAAALLLLGGGVVEVRHWRNAQPPKLDETASLIARARHLSRMVNYHRSDLVAAQNLARSATDLQINSAAAWGVRAWVQAAFIHRHWDDSASRKRDAEELANHALSLDSAQPDALEALGAVLLSKRAGAAAEPLLRQAVQLDPDDSLSYSLLASSKAIQHHPEQGFAILQAAALRFPSDPIIHYDLATAETVLYQHKAGKHYAEMAMAEFHRISSLQPMSSALVAEAHFDLDSTGDLSDMRNALNALEKFPLEDRIDDRAIYFAALGCLADGHPAEVPAITALTNRRYLDDAMAAQPVAWLDAMAEVELGHLAGALPYWQEAESVLRQKLRDDSDDSAKMRHFTVQLATTLVWLGRREDAAKLADPIAAAAQDGPPGYIAYDLTRYYLALGDIQRALDWGRLMHVAPYAVKYDPWWAPVRKTPGYRRFFEEVAEKFP